jgi:hypothetical protein
MYDLEVGKGRAGLEQGKLRVFESKCVEHNVTHSLQKVPKSSQIYKNLTYNGLFPLFFKFDFCNKEHKNKGNNFLHLHLSKDLEDLTKLKI